MRIGPYYVVMRLTDLVLRDCDAIAIFEDNLKLVMDRKDYKILKDRIGKYVGIGCHFEVNE